VKCTGTTIRLPPQAGRLRARLHALDAITGETVEEDGSHVLEIDASVEDVQRLLAAGDAEPLRALLPEPPADPM